MVKMSAIERLHYVRKKNLKWFLEILIYHHIYESLKLGAVMVFNLLY